MSASRFTAAIVACLMSLAAALTATPAAAAPGPAVAASPEEHLAAIHADQFHRLLRADSFDDFQDM